MVHTQIQFQVLSVEMCTKHNNWPSNRDLCCLHLIVVYPWWGEIQANQLIQWYAHTFHPAPTERDEWKSPHREVKLFYKQQPQLKWEELYRRVSKQWCLCTVYKVHAHRLLPYRRMLDTVLSYRHGKTPLRCRSFFHREALLCVAWQDTALPPVEYVL